MYKVAVIKKLLTRSCHHKVIKNLFSKKHRKHENQANMIYIKNYKKKKFSGFFFFFFFLNIFKTGLPRKIIFVKFFETDHLHKFISAKVFETRYP